MFVFTKKFHNYPIKLYEIMNTLRTSEKVSLNTFKTVIFRSLFYTVPFGMFLAASNFMFEYVRKYYFDWLIVIIPTLIVLISGNVYEMLLIYRKEQKVARRKRKNYIAKTTRYRIVKPELVTN